MFLEHLASYNGADMHKYNTSYMYKLNQHVLMPEAYKAKTLREDARFGVQDRCRRRTSHIG